MCKRLTFLLCVVSVLGMTGTIRAATLFHWTFDGPLGQELISDTDLFSGVTVTAFRDSSLLPTDPETVKYGEPNPWYNTGGTSADFQNRPSDNDPGAATYANDQGVGTTMDLSTLSAFTIEACIYPRTVRQCVIIRKWGGGRYYLQLRGDIAGFAINDDSNIAESVPGTIQPNTWYHVAGVFDAGDTLAPMKIYVDGELAGTAAFSEKVLDTTQSLGIGGITRDNATPPGDSGQFFDGLIDEVRISDTALDPSEFLIGPSEVTRYPSPKHNARNVPVDTVLSWSPGASAVTHEVYLGTTFDDVNVATAASGEYKGSQPRDANTYGPPGDLELGQSYYWRIDEVNDANVNSPWTGRVWSFTVVGKAYDPKPADGDDNVPLTTVLSWTTAFGAASNDVYFGTDKDEVETADNSLPVGTSVYKGNQPLDANTYTPDILEFNTPYFWRVDEVGAKIVKGDVWTFDTGDYSVVNDFEQYQSSTDLQQDWLGFGSAEGGYVNLSVEPLGRARGGDQAMEIEYWNLFGFVHSEAGYTFPAAQDWTVSDIKALQLHISGLTTNDNERLYMILEDSTGTSAIVVYDDPNALTNDEWQEWNIDLAEVADAGVDLTAIKKLFIGLGDRDAGASSGKKGFLYVDDIWLYPSRCLSEEGPTGDMNGDCQVNFEDFETIGEDWLKHSYTLTGVEPDEGQLLLWYKFDEMTGPAVADSSGRAMDATIDGATNWNTDGYVGGCLSFDDDTAVLGPNEVFTGAETSVTVCAWLSAGIGTKGRNNTLLEVGSSAGAFLRADVPDDAGNVYWKVGDSVVWDDVATAEWLDLWNHYAFVKDAKNVEDPNDDVLRIYCNGRMVVEEAGVGQPLADHLVDAQFKIGSQLGHHNDFIGNIDDFRIYGYALSQDEIVGVAAGGGNELFIPVRSLGNLVDDEEMNFKDLAVMLENWLVEELWP